MSIRTLGEIRTSRHVRGFRSAYHATGVASLGAYPQWEEMRIARAEYSRLRWVAYASRPFPLAVRVPQGASA